ncbi:MAG: hypothetical protein RLY82_818 [Pseudomonadota bacterium]|jgi:uncharacterized protein YbjT (DUF2867 family)
MRVLIFGASGLIGRGVLRECLLDSDVTEVKLVGRSTIDPAFHIPTTKLSELVMRDMFDYSNVDHELTGFDACFICLGIAAKDMANEAQYERITYTLTMAAAEVLARINPQITITYVSGAGTDGTGQSKSLWVRVKGKTEQALLALPIKQAVMFRPLAVQAMNGEVAKNGLYRFAFALATPVLSLARKLMPKYIATTEQMGRAMLSVAKHGSKKSVLESADIAQF